MKIVKKITEEIIPKIKTKRSWATINLNTLCEDGCIVIVSRTNIEYLKKYKDIILICNDSEREEELSEYGKVIIMDLFSNDSIKELQNKLNEIDKELKEQIEEENNQVNKFLEKFDEDNDIG